MISPALSVAFFMARAPRPVLAGGGLDQARGTTRFRT